MQFQRSKTSLLSNTPAENYQVEYSFDLSLTKFKICKTLEINFPFFSRILLKIENLQYAYTEIFKYYLKITKVRLWDKCPQEETNNWHLIKDALEKDHLSKDKTQNFPLLSTCQLTEKTLAFNFDRLMVLKKWHKFAVLLLW